MLTAGRSPQPVARRPLHEEVADQLRELVIEGVLAAGSRLNERVLCEHLQVSRTPLREALKLLAGERLIELNPNRGASVASLSRADIDHLFEMMADLEGMSGELAALRRTDAELAQILARHQAMRLAYQQRDLPQYFRLNREIHAAINACARNPVLSETYHAINSRLQSLRFRSNRNHDKWDAAMDDHQRMVDALTRRDAAGLRQVMVGHLQAKRDEVLAQFDSQTAVTAIAQRLTQEMK